MNLEDSTYLALHRYTKALSVALGHRDLCTRVHSDRVVVLSEAMGVRLGRWETELEILRISATFHDIGKIGVPDHILLKRTRLDESETATMQTHSAMGEDIVISTEIEGAREAAYIIRHHHERYDGAGYPDGRAGEDIPLCSRIIGIADSYDAMSTTRACHPARTHPEIMAVLLEETGGKHHPKLTHVLRDHREQRVRSGRVLTLESFRWDRQFVIGRWEVDREHRRLVELINRFGDHLIGNDLSFEDIGAVLAELSDYAHHLFEDEEGMRSLQGVDPRHLDLHIVPHRKFLVDMTSLQKGIRPGHLS